MELPIELVQRLGEHGRPLNAILKDIEWFASWDPPNQRELAASISECRRAYPDAEDEICSRIKRGEEARELLRPFYKLGSKFGTDSQEAKERLGRLKEIRPDLVDRAGSSVEKGEAARRRFEQIREKERQGVPVSSVKPAANRAEAVSVPEPSMPRRVFPRKIEVGLHPQDIRGLSPCGYWNLLIDETGSKFDFDAAMLGPRDPTLGRMVGLLLPEGHGLRPLPRAWHAVDKDTDEIDRVIQSILDGPTGVIGISVQQVPGAPVDRWSFCVLRLIDFVLRLLPVDGPTKLVVQIEQRAEFRGGTPWSAIAYAALLQLAQAYPNRASQIDCKIEVIGKQDSEFNGYVDALAYVWAGASAYSSACRDASGLVGTCFLPGDVAAITRAWEWLDRGVTLEGRDWAVLLDQPEVTRASSLSNTVLARLGQACHGDAGLWGRYLEHTISHLDSKATDLERLGRQVDWLEHWQPPGQSLPAKVRLIWLTTKLARANHLGHAEQPWLEEFQALAEKLLDENAHLVCRADLHMAVNATNRYEFELASQLVKRWLIFPKQVVGLSLWGKVHSSLGQHAAFQDRFADAIAHFDLALDGFSRLSNSNEGKLEAKQTLAYRALALMDDPMSPETDVAAAVEAVTGPLSGAIRRLAGSVSDDEKYAHHLLVRYLALRGDAQLCASYLERRDDWGIARGHPWPLIELYRALILRVGDPAGAMEVAIDAFNRTRGDTQGPVVKLIGACIRTIAAPWGWRWPADESDRFLSGIEQALPAAKPRLIKLRNCLAAPGDAGELLRDVLPYNFH